MESSVERQVAYVSEDAWWIRLWLWMWKADTSEIDFCRLFWGYVFAVPNLLVRAIAFPFWAVYRIARLIAPYLGRVADWLIDRIPERKRPPSPAMNPSLFSSPKVAPPAPKQPREHRIFKWLTRNAAAGADKLVVGGQAIWPVVKWALYGVGVLTGAGVAFICGYGLTLLVPLVPPALNACWIALQWFGHGLWWAVLPVLLILVAVAGAGLGAFWIGEETEPGRKAVKKTSQGAVTFGGMLVGGVKAVKHRTCPIIEVEKKV